MSRHNVQNLISFYLNADMYRQFAKKELARALLLQSDASSSLSSSTMMSDTRENLKEFAKGLIDTYLLNAMQFISNSSLNVSRLSRNEWSGCSCCC